MNTFLKLSLLFIIFNCCRCDDTLELSCTTDGDCTSFEDKNIQSLCHNNSCTCSLRRSNEPIHCEPRSNLKILKKSNDECPCTLPKVCENIKCVCAPGFKSTLDSRCVPKKVVLGKICQDHDQCRENDKFSECDHEECKCSKNFHQISNSCRSVVNKEERNGACTSNSECGENEECVEKKCVCLKSFIASQAAKKCLQIASYNEKCEEQIQCDFGLGVGSICEKNICKCLTNHTHFERDGQNVCVKKIFVGDPCHNHNECAPYKGEATMACKNYKCVCGEQYELYDAYSKTCAKKDNLKSSAINILLAPSNLIILMIIAKILV